MKFGPITNSLTFEFEYRCYTISIADYVSNDSIPVPEGKISVMVLKNGSALSSKTLERLSAYINFRIEGVASDCNGLLEINLEEHDQFMMVLLDGLNILIPM